MLNIEKLLKDNGMSVTKTRVKIIECLNEDDHHFHTIKDINEHTKGLNTKSVYNTIQALVDAGIIDSISIKGQTKFALNEGVTNNHDAIHIISGDKVSHVDIEDSALDSIKKSVESTGKKVKSVRIFVNVE